MEGTYFDVLPSELYQLIFYYIEDNILLELTHDFKGIFKFIFEDRYTFINKLKYNYPKFTISGDYIMSAFSNDIQNNIKVYMLVKSLLNEIPPLYPNTNYVEIMKMEVLSKTKSSPRHTNFINITIEDIQQKDFRMFELSEYDSKVLNNKINDKISNKSTSFFINIYSYNKEYHINIFTNNSGKSLIFKSNLNNIIDFLFNLIKMKNLLYIL